MENRTDKNSYTLIFAVAMVVLVGAMLAFTSSTLAPNIDKNKKLEKQQNANFMQNFCKIIVKKSLFTGNVQQLNIRKR